MRKIRFGSAVALAVPLLLVLGTAPLLAEDSNVFKNGAHIGTAQGILVSEGYLASDSFTPGILDEATQAALAQYQTVHSLNSRGTLDDDTFQMLTSHEAAYPWDAEETIAEARPEAVERVEEPVVAEAPPIPASTPTPAVVKEAPARPAAGESVPSDKMPATGSALPLLALSGLALIGGGALLLRQRAV